MRFLLVLCLSQQLRSAVLEQNSWFQFGQYGRSEDGQKKYVTEGEFQRGQIEKLKQELVKLRQNRKFATDEAATNFIGVDHTGETSLENTRLNATDSETDELALVYKGLDEGNLPPFYETSAVFLQGVKAIPNIQITDEKDDQSSLTVPVVRFHTNPTHPHKWVASSTEEKKLLRNENMLNDTAAPETKVFFLCGEHARELISPASCRDFLQKLATGKTGLQNVNTMMIPNLNEKGHDAVMQGDWCKRTDENEVDLNRNYDAHWHPFQESDLQSQTNPGPKPFSEGQTRIVKKLVGEFKPDLFLSVHSGTVMMFMPPGWTTEIVPGNYRDQLNMMYKVDSKNKVNVPFGTAARTIHYLADGTSLDYAASELKVPNAFGVEVYTRPEVIPGLHAEYDNLVTEYTKNGSLSSDATGTSLLEQGTTGSDAQACFLHFNPVTESEYAKTLKTWSSVYTDFIKETQSKKAAGPAAVR